MYNNHQQKKKAYSKSLHYIKKQQQ